ncbi:MAG: MMPL family transporter [Frankiaceae bacterium]|nr:MMPL family transporter [Frankiaceae bacterium]
MHETKSRGLARLVRGCVEHPRRTFGIWLAAIAAIFLVSHVWGGRLVNDSNIPGSDSQQAVDLLKASFPERSGDAARVVFSSDTPLTSSEGRQTIAAAEYAVGAIPGVISVGDPFATKGGALSKDGKIGFFEAQFDKPAHELDAAVIDQIEPDVRAAVGNTPIDVEFGGPVLDAKAVDSKTSDTLGLAAAIVILLIVLGTAVAMAVPLVVALVSVGLGSALLTIAAAFSNFNTITPILAVMIGLGVAIDYALFIVMRFRQELESGESPVEAATTAGSTAGRAVIFAGTTVAISISGLALVGIPFVAKMGYGTAMSVVVAVCTAVTLLPALLAKIGHRIYRIPVPIRRPRVRTGPGKIDQVSAFVQRNPKRVVAATAAALAVMAIPVLSLNMGTADDGTNPSDTTTRKAYDLLAQGFGPGFNGPLLVAVDMQGDTRAVSDLAASLKATPGVALVGKPTVNDAGDTAQIAVFPTTSPQATETADLVHTVRDEVIPSTLAHSPARAYVGGQTASNEDVASKLMSNFAYFLLFIVGITCLVLTMAFRSIVIAVKAVIATSLSALAAFGALVAVFQWGWLQSFVGLDRTGPTASYLPVIVLSILFGLSMDYEVFIASRIREEYIKSGDASGAVRAGVSAVGRVIVAAAVIMGVVFWAFVLTPDRTVKSFGLGLGVAILVDALIVRMLLVPAVMHLLGSRAWYLPRWLDRVLPRVTIEAPEASDDGPSSFVDLPRAA